MKERFYIGSTATLLVEEKIKQELLRYSDMTFCARDLGFPDHTPIHNAAKEIIADHMARAMVKFRYVVEDFTSPDYVNNLMEKKDAV